MSILDRYIIKTIVSFVLLITSVVVGLGAILTFSAEQTDVGVGAYTAAAAGWYTLLNLPQTIYMMLPVTALIGSMVGMGSLARGSELTVIRATGISIGRIALTAAIAGVILMVADVLLGEFIAPQLTAAAREHKAFLKYSNISFGSGTSGAWVRDGNLILNVTGQSGQFEFGGMQIFELSPQHRLMAVGRAGTAKAEGPEGRHKWRLGEYVESRLQEDSVQAQPLSDKVLSSNVTAGFLGLAVQDPALLTSRSLLQLIRYDQANALDASQYVFTFWSRAARTLAILFAVLLPIPFVLGSLRSAGAGTRAMLAMIMGVGIILLQRVIASGTFVFDLNPVLLAWTPTVLLGSVTMAMLYRAMRGGMIR